MSFEMVIGIEVHAQLSTKSKAWCSCQVGNKGFENTSVCEVCSAQPGTLPKVNKKAVEYACLAGLALNCEINKFSRFDRKNYFYPDLPKGYQITQFDLPIAYEGNLSIASESGETKKVGIERVQMEEDTGKSLHEGEYSLINLNRAGTPLIEIVSKPDIRSANEAVDYLKQLRSILIYLDICEGNMQDGNFRCDVNLSIREKGTEAFGTRTEVKNLNSFKSVEKAIAYEFERHQKILNAGEKVKQQTLLFDVESGKTTVLRDKSDADDYRYFPEPDLPPVILTDTDITNIKNTLPELPKQKVQRFIEEYSLSEYDSTVLASDKHLANFYEQAVDGYKQGAKKIANWITSELLRYINEAGIEITKSPVKAIEIQALVKEIDQGTISGKIAKDIFLQMYDTGKGAKELIEASGAKQISDDSLIRDLAKELVAKHTDEVQQFLAGRDRVLGFFVGQIMKATKGQANPQLTSEIVKEVIKESAEK